jgi:thiamine transport system permease protein
MGYLRSMNPLYFFITFFFGFMTLGLLFPLVYLVYSCLTRFGLQALLDISTLHIIVFNYGQALLSSVLAGLVGVFLAIYSKEGKFPGREWLGYFSDVTFFIPTLLVVLSLVGLWGQNGWLNRLTPSSGFYGWFGILLAHVFFNFSVFFKIVGQAWSEMDRTDERVALSLGATRWFTFWKVTLPKLKSALVHSFSLVFLYCSSSFLVLLLLGGGPKFSGIETMIYQAIKVDLNLPLALALAFIQLVVCLTVQQLARPLPKTKLFVITKNQNAIFFRKNSLVTSILTLVAMGFMGLVVISPIVNLVISGLAGLSQVNFEQLLQCFILSLALGAKVSLFSTVLSFSAAYSVRHLSNPLLKRVIVTLCTLPVALSTMVLGLGLMLSYSSVDGVVRSGLWGVVLIQGISVLPLCFRMVWESLMQIDPILYETAESLGAGKKLKLWFLEIPSTRKALISAFMTALGFSLGETGAVMLFETQGNVTVPLWMFKLMGRYQFEQAQTVGALLLLVMIAFLVIRKKWESLA